MKREEAFVFAVCVIAIMIIIIVAIISQCH